SSEAPRVHHAGGAAARPLAAREGGRRAASAARPLRPDCRNSEPAVGTRSGARRATDPTKISTEAPPPRRQVGNSVATVDRSRDVELAAELATRRLNLAAELSHDACHNIEDELALGVDQLSCCRRLELGTVLAFGGAQLLAASLALGLDRLALAFPF